MSDPIYYRFRSLQEKEGTAEDGSIDMLASTDDAIDFGGYREVLKHGNGIIDTSAARALLINHDSNQIAGNLNGMIDDGRTLSVKATISPNAKMQSGITVMEAVKSGALRGVSIGYSYSNKDAAYDEATRTVTVNKWRLHETSLTPIPADKRAMVRSLPEHFKPVAVPATETKESRMSEDIKEKPISQGQESAKFANVEANDEKSRAQAMEIARQAESVGLKVSDFVSLKPEEANVAMLRALAEKNKTKEPEAVKVEVIRDASDKSKDAAVASMLALHDSGSKEDIAQAERGLSALDIIRRHASRSGQNVSDWNKADVAAYALGMRVPGMRSTANVTSSNFNTVVLASIMDKAVFNGFNLAGLETTYQKWTRRRLVADFKQFSSGALDSGNLVQTVENVAFPELTKAEGSYSATLGIWGATISLTHQALINDDLGEFMNMLNRAGAIANRTIEKQVYAVVNAATWTDNTTSVTGLATAGDLDTVRTAFDEKTGPGGEILGNKPRFLLAPSCLRTAALQATTAVQGNTEFKTNIDLEPIITPFLTKDGTAAQSKFYLAADPKFVDTVTVAFRQGAEGPQVVEYDAGAVAARKWKIMQEFVAALATTTVNGTVYIPGMYQGA